MSSPGMLPADGPPTVPEREDRVDPAFRQHQLRLGMWIFLGTVTMLFAAFTSAYMVRSAGSDWAPVGLPTILWFNTGVLLASSGALEIARRHGRGHAWRDAGFWLLVTLILGAAFVSGQVTAWRQLVDAGITVPSNPYAAFFYIFTGLHGLHLLAGLVLLAVTGVQVAGARRRAPSVDDSTRWNGLLELGAILWHFLAGLWIWLFLVLVLYR